MLITNQVYNCRVKSHVYKCTKAAQQLCAFKSTTRLNMDIDSAHCAFGKCTLRRYSSFLLSALDGLHTPTHLHVVEDN